MVLEVKCVSHLKPFKHKQQVAEKKLIPACNPQRKHYLLDLMKHVYCTATKIDIY